MLIGTILCLASRASSAAQSLVDCAVLQAFELFDTDHDGVISPEEFVKVTAALGFGGSSQELLERAREADEDGNGEIGEFNCVHSVPLFLYKCSYGLLLGCI